MNEMVPDKLPLAIIHLRRLFPEWRFGQLIVNLATAAGCQEIDALWDVEDDDLRAAAQRLIANNQVRNETAVERSQIYHCHPEIMSGTPVFTGTRVPVHSLVDHLASGVPLDDFLDDFPSVTREQALAFLALSEEVLLGASNAASV